jgi:hypothetical protein
MKTFARAVTIIAIASCIALPASGQEKGPYSIRINRACKAGDKFAFRSLAQVTSTRTSSGAGSSAASKLDRSAILIEGDMEIEAVTPREGQAWKYRLKVAKCVAGEKAGAEVLIPAGGEITVELTSSKAPLLKVNGKSAPEPLLSLLKTALPGPVTDDTRPDDAMFGSAAKKAEEDEWKPDITAVTAEFKKRGFTGDASAIKSRARLTELTDWEGVPCILVKGDVTIDPCAIPEVPAGAAIKQSRMSFQAEFYLPLDTGLPVAREKRQISESATFTPPGGAISVNTEKLTAVSRTLARK